MSMALQYLSALFAFVAALLWWVSATVKTPREFNVHVHAAGTLGALRGGLSPLLGYGFSPELTELGKALVRQSRLSAWGAIFAGAAATLQGFAFLL